MLIKERLYNAEPFWCSDNAPAVIVAWYGLASFCPGRCVHIDSLAGVSKKTLPIPFFAALLSAVIFHKKFLTSLAGLLNCVLTAHGKSAGVVEMLVEKSSDPWFALCVGAVIVSTVQSIFSRLDSRVFTVAMLALFLCAGIFIDIPLYYATAEVALGILALTFSGGIKGDLKPFVLILTAFCAVLIACLTGLLISFPTLPLPIALIRKVSMRS